VVDHGKDCHASDRHGHERESRKGRIGLHGRLLSFLPDVASLVVKISERHRRPPPDLRTGPLAPELDDGVQVPPVGALGTPLPLAGGFGTHWPDGVAGIPCFGFGTHWPDGVAGIPFFGFGTHWPDGVAGIPFFGFGSLGLAFGAFWWQLTSALSQLELQLLSSFPPNPLQLLMQTL
jgi:hypothetical protein